MFGVDTTLRNQGCWTPVTAPVWCLVWILPSEIRDARCLLRRRMQAHRKLFIVWDGFPRSGVPQVTFFFPLKNVTVFIFYVLACTHTMAYICGGQRTTCRIWFSSSTCGSWELDSGRRVWLARKCLYSLSHLAGPQFSFLISCHKSSDLVFLENKRIFKHFTELKKTQCDMIP